MAAASAVAGAEGFLEAVLLIFAFMAFFLLELPYEPLEIFPFLDFLSPLPMYYFDFERAIIIKSLLITN